MNILLLQAMLVSRDVGIYKKRIEIEKEADDIIHFEKKLAKVVLIIFLLLSIKKDLSL